MLQGIKLASTDADIIEILMNVKSIAVVGSSPSSTKDSYQITKYLIEKGYKVYPVNPTYQEILGLKSYKSLLTIPETIDLVNVFRRPEFSLDVAKEAVSANAKIIWFQLGVASSDAIQYSLEHNLTVVYDRCIKVEHLRLI